MPASCADTSADTSADTNSGNRSGTALTLSVDVQFSAALGPDLAGFPAADEIEHWARHAFVHASVQGWDLAWRTRTRQNAPGESITNIDSSQLCVRLVDATEGAALNATWRNKQAPTNVLSFDADILLGQHAPLGDLVLCVPVIEREAMQQGKSVAHHCAHMLVHGVLHLLGFDHLIESEAQAMEAMEAAVLGELGIGNPYE